MTHTFTFRDKSVIEQVVLFTCLRGTAEINVMVNLSIYYFLWAVVGIMIEYSHFNHSIFTVQLIV